jgi:hypothetical protein
MFGEIKHREGTGANEIVRIVKRRIAGEYVFPGEISIPPAFFLFYSFQKSNIF